MIGLAIPPYLISRAIDDGLRPRDWPAVRYWALLLLLVGVLNAWVGTSRHRTMTRIRLEASFRTSRAVVAQVTKLGAELDRKVTSGDLAVLGLADVFTTSRALTVTGPGVGAIIAYTIVGILLAQVSGVLAFTVMLGVPALALCIGPILSRVIGRQETYREQQGNVLALLLDIVAGLRVLNAFGGKDTYSNRFIDESRELREQGYRVGAATSWIGGLAVGLPAVFLAGVTWLAARLALDGTITIGELVAVYGYVAMLVVPVFFFIEGADQISRAVVSARRIIDFLNMDPSSAAAHRTELGPPEPSRLHDPLSGIDLAPGVFTGLVSSEPSDLTAIVNRLAGLETSISVTWGDRPIEGIRRDELRRRILVADNDAHLFAGTVRSVILAGTVAADQAVRDAVHVASAADVVQALHEGLDSPLRESGTNVSEGQRQRIRLARAALVKPEVLLAVEPTSSLDAPTEAIVAERLRDSRAGLTTVIASSSPLILTNTDMVYFVVGGRVAASGTHRQLFDTVPEYRTVVSRDGAESNG